MCHTRTLTDEVPCIVVTSLLISRRTCDHRYTNFGANVTTVLDAAKIHLPVGTKILSAKGAEVTGNSTAGFAEALAIAAQADFVIAVVGDSGAKGWTMNTCGEDDDRTQLGACKAIVMMRFI